MLCGGFYPENPFQISLCTLRGSFDKDSDTRQGIFHCLGQDFSLDHDLISPRKLIS